MLRYALNAWNRLDVVIVASAPEADESQGRRFSFQFLHVVTYRLVFKNETFFILLFYFTNTNKGIVAKL